MQKVLPILILALIFLLGCQNNADEKSNFNIHVYFSESASSGAKDGRLLLMLSSNDEKEPRFQINDGLKTQLIYGMNVDELNPNQAMTFDNKIFGYPYPSLSEVPPGEYTVQALLHVYETFNL